MQPPALNFCVHRRLALGRRLGSPVTFIGLDSLGGQFVGCPRSVEGQGNQKPLERSDD
jgi:hypothetical protein